MSHVFRQFSRLVLWQLLSIAVSCGITLTSQLPYLPAAASNPCGSARQLEEQAFLLKQKHQFAEAERLYRQALTVAESKLQPATATTDIDMWALLTNFGECLESQGKLAEAQKSYTRALAYGEKHYGKDHPLLGWQLKDLAKLYFKQHDYKNAEVFLERAMTVRRNDLKRVAPGLIDEDVYLLGLTGMLATVESRLGKTTQAEQLFLTWYNRSTRGSDEEKLQAFQGYIEFLRKSNRGAEAESVATRARSVMGEKGGLAFGSRGDIWQSLIYEGDAALKKKNLSGAEEKYICALKLSDSSSSLAERKEASLLKLAQVYMDWQRTDEAEKVLSQAFAMDKKRGKSDRQLQGILASLARAKFALGKIDESELLFKQAFQIMENNRGMGALELARLFSDLCDLRTNDARQWQKIESLYRQLLAATTKSLGQDNTIVALCSENLGMVLWWERKKEEAVLQFKRAIGIYRKAAGRDDANVGHVLLSLGDVYLYSYDYVQSEAAFKRSVLLLEQRWGKDSREVAGCLARLIEVYRSQGRYDKAEPLAKRCVAIWVAVEGSDGTSVINALEQQSQLLETQKKWAQAIAPRKRLLAIWKKEPQSWSSYAGSLDKLADDYAKAGQPDFAEPLYLQAFVLWEKQLKEDNSSLVSHIDRVARFYLDARKYQQSCDWYKRSLTLCEKLCANRDSQSQALALRQPLLNLASARQDALQYAEAEQLLRRALSINEKAYGVDGGYQCCEILTAYAGLLKKMGRPAEASRVEERARQCRLRYPPPTD